MSERDHPAQGAPKRKIGLLVGKLAGGGAERMVSKLSFALADRYDVTVLILRPERRDYEASGRVTDLGGGRKSPAGKVLHAVRTVNRVIREERLEAVISFLDAPNVINGLFNRACPKAVSIRSWQEKALCRGIAGRVLFFLRTRAYRAADAVITLTERQRASLIREMKLDPGRVLVLENLFDSGEILRQSEEEPEERIPREFLTPLTAVAVGRLAASKNTQRLLRVFALVREELPDAKLLIAGEGPCREGLEKLCGELGIADSVFFAGRLADPFPAERRAGLYVSMSENEGFPNACVEAMILGLPVLHTDCPTGPAEILGAGAEGDEACFAPYGVLVPREAEGESEERRRRSAAGAWVRLLSDRELHNAYAEKGRVRAQDFGIEEIVPEYHRLIEGLCRKDR